MTDRFDHEVEVALARPGMTYSVAEKIKKYPEWARRKITAHAHQVAQQWRDDAAARIDTVMPALDEARDRLAVIERGLDDGTMTAVEAISALDSVRQEMRTTERRYDAACSTDAHAETLWADPVGQTERLFDTYQGLADRRITIHDYVAELEQKVNPLDRAAMRRI